MKNRIKIKQRDITDCGAACLASISAHYGFKMPIAKIRQLASTNQRGTNALGLIEAANAMGMTAKGMKGKFEAMKSVPTPFIAHTVVKNELHHYVVVYKMTNKHIIVMDPGEGRMIKYSHAEFQKIWTGIIVMVMPNEQFETGDETTSSLKRFWYLIKPYKLIMTQALLGAVLYTILGLSTSIYVQKIVDYVLVDGNRNLLNLMSVVMIILLGLQIYLGATKSLFGLKTGQRIDAQLLLGYYKHLMRLPQTFFDTMRSGEIISRVNDAVKIRTFINDVSVELVVNFMIVAFTFTLMFVYSWKLAMIMLLAIPFYAGIYLLINYLNRRHQRKLMENAAELESQLVESVGSIATIKRFGLESHSNLKTELRFVDMLKSTYTSGKNSLFSTFSSEFISRLLTIVLLWIGSGLVVDQTITPGELMSFYALIGQLTNPINSIINANRSIQDALIAADRLFEIMDLDREETSEHKIELTRENIGNIQFQNVQFRYGSRADVFENLNLSIEKGKMTAIVGGSGSGKTTLLSLLQNIYPIKSGSISIGNNKLENISNESLRSIVGVVPQKVDLFAGTVLENIAVGDFEPDLQKAMSICEKIGISSFIESLPQGYNTHVGEDGTALSGGQKQRISIARALYKDPEILILDEATSSLDSASERYIQDAINVLNEENKTVIVIAHRLSTIMGADKIILLDKGVVKEEGSHQELLLKGSYYTDLWYQQFPVLKEVA